MISLLRHIFKAKYQTLNYLEIDAQNIISNYDYLQSLQPEAALFPVLKANAYGHGLKELCTILNHTNAQMVALDSYPEAQIAYKYFKGKILLLSEMPLSLYRHCNFKRTEFVVYNEVTLRHLAKYKKKANVHLFINTGMNREGIKDLASFIEENRNYLDAVNISGACSHLATANERNLLNTEQEELFMENVDLLRQNGYFPKWLHLGNSAGVFNLDNRLLTAFRPGLALYGYNPLTRDDETTRPLKPALEAFSHISAIQALKPGDNISYGDNKAKIKTNIATIPFGYYEGLDRRLAKKVSFQVSNNEEFEASIAGQVCMNMTLLDLGLEEVEIGDEVKVISAQRDDSNSIENLAEVMDTISYEVLIKLNANIRRYLINLPKIR